MMEKIEFGKSHINSNSFKDEKINVLSAVGLWIRGYICLVVNRFAHI